jgi:PilZ domain
VSQTVASGSPSDASEGRSSERMSSLIRAIIIQVGQAPIHCTIVDLTEAGAKLSTKDAFLIAGEIQIEIPLRDVVKFARVVWRRAETVGIEFSKERSFEAAIPAKGPGIDQTTALLREIPDRLARIEQRLGVA